MNGWILLMVGLVCAGCLAPTTASADTKPRPDLITLRNGEHPDQKILARDVLGCARVIGLHTIEQLQTYLAAEAKSMAMVEVVRLYRSTADYLECMDKLGYVVPIK